MSTRLADLTQYRNWWLNNANPVIKEYKLAAACEQIGLKPISSALLESVQVFNEPEITIGPIPHPDNDQCPDNCDSKLIHGLYGDDRDNGVFGNWYARNHTPNPGMGGATPVLHGMQYDKPLTATVPTDGKTVMLDREFVTGYMPMKEQLRRAEAVNTGWKIGMPTVDALLQECSNCHSKYPRIKDGLCEQCWCNPDFLKLEEVEDESNVVPDCMHFQGFCPTCLVRINKPMTLSRAVQVLNACNHNGGAWLVCVRGKSSYAHQVGCSSNLDEFTALAVAEKLVRDAK